MPLVGVRVEEDLYRRLIGRAKEEGVSVSDIVRRALLLYLGEPSGSASKPTVDRAHIQRVVQDLVNPFTQKVDEIAKRLSLVVERLDALEERIRGIEEKVKGFGQR